MDPVKAEHIDRQKRSMDDHKRLGKGAKNRCFHARNQLERKLGMS